MGRLAMADAIMAAYGVMQLWQLLIGGAGNVGKSTRRQNGVASRNAMSNGKCGFFTFVWGLFHIY
eukprot:scaffold6994_cov145-Skeletonema_dohrnii-CCMP3373.AAC.5